MGMANVDGKDYIVDKVGRVNRDIEWKEGAVFYANGFGWFSEMDYSDDVINIRDFQLNEPRQGDYIPKSELDTEQKYNDAVEVFGLFGCERVKSYESFLDYHSLYLGDNRVISCPKHYGGKERKLTYDQLMAIGKLKRLMNERDNLKRLGEYCRCVAVNLGDVKSVEPCEGGFSVGYECNTSEKPNSCDKPKLATQYLNECIDVQKQRGEQYNSTGTGERSFAAAASAFNSLTGQNLKGSDVCLLLTCVKAVRQYSNPNRLHDDSLLDGVSYLSLWAEELNKELK